MADVPVPTSPTYCTAADVADIRREARYSDHEDRGRPTLTRVNETILWAEDEIDRTTRHAWRQRRVTNEYRDLDGVADVYGFIPVDMRHRAIRTLAAVDGAKVEVRAGSSWEDYLQTRAQGVGGDFWIQEELGILYIKRRYFAIAKDAVRLSYDYGESAVPRSIKRAAALLVAAELEIPSVRPSSDGGNVLSVRDRAEDWRREARTLLAGFVEVSDPS